MSPSGYDEQTDDRWLDWLLRGRDAGQSEMRNRSLAYLQPIFERVAAGARIQAGDTIVEVGAGEGRLGLLALQAAGPDARLLLTDISDSVVEHLRTELHPRLADQISILQTPAESLTGVPDESVDVVLVRSVLIYSPNQPAAFDAFARVLKPGGRLSLFEPLWTFFPSAAAGEFFGRDVSEVTDEVHKMLEGFQAAPGSSTGLAVSAPSFISAAEAAGFGAIRTVIEADSLPLAEGDDAAVGQALHGRPNPNTPTPAELASTVLSAEQGRRFLAELAAAVRAGRGRTRTAALYLTADKQPLPGSIPRAVINAR